MGKTLQSQDSTISLENGNPGCMRGLFHHFNHHRWHNVKRRLPHGRHSTGKLSAVVGDPGNDLNNTTDAGEEQGKPDARMANSTIQAKLSEPGSGHKGSMRSRIKALITEEVSKRRGRHRRSSSLPSQIVERTPSVHHLEASNRDPYAKVELEDEILEYQDNVHSYVSSLLDPLLPNISDESITSSKTCDLCAATLAMNYLRQSEVNEHGNHPVKDHILLQDRSIYAIEPSKNASLQESKLFLDALDLLNMRKELFLKVLQDPTSSLCHHLHGHKASTQRLGLRKSVSFPSPHSSGKVVPMLHNRKNKKDVGSSTEGENRLQVGNEDSNLTLFSSINELSKHSSRPTGQSGYDEAPKQLLMGPELQDNVTLGSPQSFKDQHNNKLIVKRLQSLREKIKHAIKESKKERHRIIMDAVLHKVPFGRRYPKNIKEEGNMHTGSMTEKCHSPGSSSRSECAFGKSRLQQFRRTSSFNESCERYNRLLELCFSREANHCMSDSLSLKTTGSPLPINSSPKLLERILSLQDLRSYSFSRIEGSLADYSSSVSPIRPVLACIPSIGSRRFGDQKPSSLENQNQSTASSENGSQENSLEGSDTFKDTGELERREGIPHHDRVTGPTVGSVHISTLEKNAMAKGSAKFSTAKDSELTPWDLSLYEKDAVSNLRHELSTDCPMLPDTNIVISKAETPIYGNLLHFQVDRRNEAEFDYVRDVLKRSGFSGNEFLGKWHSAEQPVDPSVFEEVEAQLDSSGNERVGSCYQLLLFDLINEVLLDIYDRSFSYWPVPLTCRSHVHPMPAGQHVLDEVWANIRWYLTPRPEFDQSLDDAVSRDLAKDDGWMNIQFEAECVGLELEDLIFDDLLEEVVLA